MEVEKHMKVMLNIRIKPIIFSVSTKTKIRFAYFVFGGRETNSISLSIEILVEINFLVWKSLFIVLNDQNSKGNVKKPTVYFCACV